jgi:ligand-binding sensor domain-containing protein
VIKTRNLLVGTRGGLSIYDHKTERFINFKNVVGHALLNDQINVVFEDNPEVIWLGMRNYGLISYNRKTGKVETLARSITTRLPLPQTMLHLL